MNNKKAKKASNKKEQSNWEPETIRKTPQNKPTNNKSMVKMSA